MEPRISIVTLGVEDLPRAVEFYHDGLGLPLHDENTESIAFFENRGTWLALYPNDALAEDVGVEASRNGFSGVTLAHNVRSREEVDAVLDEAVSRLGQVCSNLRTTRSGAGIPVISPILTGIFGRSRGIHIFGSSEVRRYQRPA